MLILNSKLMFIFNYNKKRLNNFFKTTFNFKTVVFKNHLNALFKDIFL